MEIYKNKGYHVGTFDDFFSKEEIERLKVISESIKVAFQNPNDIDCKTQHSGNHFYPFYNGVETYIHPYTDLPQIDSYMENNGYRLLQRWKSLRGSAYYENKTELIELMRKAKFDIIHKFYGEYGFNEEDIDIGNEGTIGMYERGDFQPSHLDAGSERTIFGCIFYLTNPSDWNEESGGEFLINKDNTIVEPIFGNYVLLDFVDNLLDHEVLRLTKDYRRYTLISFPSVIVNGSNSVNRFLEKKRKSNVIIP